ncbi:RUS1 family protein C16orf58 [Schistosoma japonicum]|uniref:RUS1 family protein C16orf58 n=1 Tax=Schistosoma japonicum TaxID=6182 RepID=A0A4Z2CMN9_SCHJA|nr:RUS1 family protein C16orf58 [Schistosoma japonicum]
MVSKAFVESYGDEISRVFTLEKNQNRRLSTLFGLHLSWVTLKKCFLPVGYPSSVSDDYLEYQIWDTIQAFASSITGALASQAVLIGVGVGNSSATILGASLTWMFKDGSGMIGRILFAGYHGINLDCDCKFWRFVADIFNDCALFLELISPLFDYLFIPLLCFANLLKSLVGVAGSATRAAIVQHQAIDNNLADVSAKDGSQETLSNLMAWFLNFILLYMVTGNQILIWLCFICCTTIHLYCNYRAVKCLKLRTFNRTRFHLAIQSWFEQQLCDVTSSNLLFNNNTSNDNNLSEYILRSKSFPHVVWVNECEPIMYKTDQPIIKMGCSLYSLPVEGQILLPDLIPLCEKNNYILYCSNWKAVQQGWCLFIFVSCHLQLDTKTFHY